MGRTKFVSWRTRTTFMHYFLHLSSPFQKKIHLSSPPLALCTLRSTAKRFAIGGVPVYDAGRESLSRPGPVYFYFIVVHFCNSNSLNTCLVFGASGASAFHFFVIMQRVRKIAAERKKTVKKNKRRLLASLRRSVMSVRLLALRLR